MVVVNDPICKPLKTVSEMFSAYRMVQPATAMYVGGVPGSAAANGAAAAAAAQQSIVYTTLPQYQTQ